MSNLIECEKGYVWNPQTRQYIVYLKEAGKQIVVPEALHKGLMQAYVDDVPLSDIAVKFTFPEAYIIPYKTIFGWKRRGLAITDEDATELSVSDASDKMLEQKKFEILQEYNKKSWKKIQEDANKWLEFVHRKFEPFEVALKNWKPIELKPFKSSLADSKSDKVFVAVLSDLHYGSASKSCYMFNRPDWNTQKTVQCVDKFANEITNEVNSRNYKFKKCVIIGLGDLIHSLDGKTTRGTELTFDCVKEEQFDYAIDSLRIFIQRMIELFGKCEVHSVGGNHNYETEVIMFRALEMYFRTDNRVKFFHYSSRPSYFVCDKTLIMMDHGADHKERAYVPPRGPKLEKHVSSLLLSIPKVVSSVKTKLFIQGDKHHWENVEYNDFEFIMFSTTLVGDQHASVNNYKNRARQSCLILDSSGLKEIIHTYFNGQS